MAEVAPSLSPRFFHTGESCAGCPEPGLSSLLQPPAVPLHDALAGKPGLVSSSGAHESFFPPRRKEWDDLFLNSNYLARIREAGISGRLRSSRFRSVCWKVNAK